MLILALGEASKKLVFFYFLSNRGGGLGEYKKSLSENTKTFLTRVGGLTQSKRVLSEKLRFFGIICQKRFFHILKCISDGGRGQCWYGRYCCREESTFWASLCPAEASSVRLAHPLLPEQLRLFQVSQYTCVLKKPLYLFSDRRCCRCHIWHWWSYP